MQVLRNSSFSNLSKFKFQLDDLIKEKKLENLALSASDFVEFQPDFLDKESVLYQTVLSELESIGFKSTSDKAETTWLTSTGEEYVWSSSSGHSTVKEPVDIGKYPGIVSLMQDINSKFGCNLNSCLASSYRTGGSATRYHSDDENSLDPSQGIYVVSFGASRTIDILQAAANKSTNSKFFVEATDCSLYIMKPGCQENFVHKVRSASSVKDRRFSLSFRCMVTQKQTATSSEINESVTLETPAIESSASPEATTTTTTTTTTTSETGGSAAHKVAPIYYRFVPRQPKKRKTTVLFGTSMTKYVREKQLGFRGRKVINVSHSGAKIKDIYLNVREFYSTHQAALSDDVEKIIFSFGTNDIKYSKVGVRHLKKLIDELVDMTKCLFPAAIILFQCCLPIRCMYPYIARNVVDFNNMLREICFFNNCVYIDCFSSFLTSDLKFCNKYLYHDWLHLNNRGVGVLCTWLKYVVNENSFDRIVNNLVGL